jgi:hypothetical protein
MEGEDEMTPSMTAPTIFVTGYAKLPAGITASELSKMLGIALEIDPADGRVVRADCTLVTRLAKEFFAGLVEGRHLPGEIDEVVRGIEARYFGSAQKPLIAALRVALERYEARSPAPPGTARPAEPPGAGRTRSAR